MIYAVNVFRICYLLFLYQVLQDLQETLEFEIFGPSGSMESKSTEADDIESKTHTLNISEIKVVRKYLLSENSLTSETILDTNIEQRTMNEQVK